MQGTVANIDHRAWMAALVERIELARFVSDDDVRRCVEAAEVLGSDWQGRVPELLRSAAWGDASAAQRLIDFGQSLNSYRDAHTAASVAAAAVFGAMSALPDGPVHEPAAEDRSNGLSGQIVVTRGALGISTRSLNTRAETVDQAALTVDSILTTETAVPMYDSSRFEVVPEILRADGAILPQQVPLLDAHRRDSMSKQLGSVRNMRVSGEESRGRLHFARTQSAIDAFRNVAEGHATDVSAGYQILEKTYIPSGQRSTVGGKSYSGPVNVVTKWRLREVSVVPIGADENSKIQ